MSHVLAHGVAGLGRGAHDVHAVLSSAEDPAQPLAPGSALHLELTVSADAGAGFAYLLLDDLAGAVTVTSAEQAEWFPEQRAFRVRSDAGATAVGRFVLQVPDDAAGPTLRPSIAVGAIAGRRAVRTAALSDGVFRVLRDRPVGLRLVVPAGGSGTVPLPPGHAGALQVGSPRFGVARVTEDGRGLRYEPRPGFTGYDRFTYTRRGGAGGTVTVHVGDLDDAPGVLTPPSADGTGTTGFRPWQENEVVGALPWPGVLRAARGTDDAR